MWDCTLTSPKIKHEVRYEGGKMVKYDGTDARPVSHGPVSVAMSPRGKQRPKGESCWHHYQSWTTPREMEDHPLKEYASGRSFRLACGKFACKECNDNVLRTIEGMNIHMRTAHDKLEVYSSFSSSAPESASGGRANANIPKGRDGHRSKLIRELKNLGVTAGQLQAEGYALGELKQANYSLKELLAVGTYTLLELRKAGVTQGLKGAGIAVKTLSEAGYALSELRKAGFSSSALKSGAGSSLGDLKGAGFQLHDLKEAGFPLSELTRLTRPNSADPAFTLQELIAEGYHCKELKAAGYNLHALRSGYSEQDLKVTHATTAAELKDDGFSLQELKLAGFSAQELKHEGFTVKDLVAVGFSKAQIKLAGGT